MNEAVESILTRIRPAINYDGGDIELVKINKRSKTVYIRFIGACTHCSISEITLKHLVENEIKKAIPSIASVVAVQ